MNVIEQTSTVPHARLAFPRELSGRMRSTIALSALGVLVVTGVILAVDSASAPSAVVSGSMHSFPGWVSGPLRIFGGSRLTGGTYSELTYAMCLAYLVVLACSKWIGVRTALITVGIMHGLFLLTPPLASTDIWNYIGYSHLGALHGLSPYAHVPAAARHDPAFMWVTWPYYKTPYGPIFTALTYLTAPLGVAGGLWTLKVLLTAAGIGTLRLVWYCSRRLGLDPVPGLLLVGLSPAWLIWTIGGAHNDVLMLVLGLGGLALWLSGRDVAAAFLIVLAAGVKMPAIVLLPFLFLRSRDRRRAALGAAAGLVTVAAVSLITFGSLRPLSAFSAQDNFDSPRSLMGQVLRLFSASGSTHAARLPATLFLIAAVIVLLVWAWRGANPIAAAGWATAALLLALLWEFPWYVTWLLPLAALARDRRLKVVAVTMSVVLLVTYVSPDLLVA